MIQVEMKSQELKISKWKFSALVLRIGSFLKAKIFRIKMFFLTVLLIISIIINKI